MTQVRRDLPSGTVTLLFTDIEGSTKLLAQLGPESYADALAAHRRVLREAFVRHGGVEVDTQGDAFFVAFPTAPGALAAAREAQEALARGPIRVRMALHTGTPHLVEEGYVGQDVHKGARLAASGHGGQVLLSKETRAFVHADVTDLGEHRLKDIEGPVWIFQLGTKRFPLLKTISNTNLPRPASAFVGREREVVEVVSLLREGARLLTLTGPGGSGKTRLAIEAAAELVPEFKAGVFWVGLASLRDPALVTETIAQTLGAKDGLAGHIGERELLLLIDNLEQVVDAAPELSALVETCPNLMLLVTSRERLRVGGEVEYPVLPLAEPDAVDLFCVRARTGPDETVHRLCRALDSLPLAIELAAARASVLSPRQMLERVSERLDLLKGRRDAAPRQQTLRATIEWSYDLLSKEEKVLFGRLSVFAGGCTLDSTEDVAGADLDPLQSLVDKSLIRHTGERFSMLETIREYAAERLEESGEAEQLRRRHAEHFLALAEEAEPNLRGSPREWLDRLESEHDNLRAVLDWLEASGENQLSLRLAGVLSRFWAMRGHLAEGRRHLENALRTDEQPTAARAKALNGLALVAISAGDAATGTLRAEEGLTLHRTLRDPWGTAHASFLLGAAATELADFARAQPLLEESLRVFRELGDEHYTLLATRVLAWTHFELGDRARARALHEEVVRRARASQNERMAATSLGALAEYALYERRVEEALPMLTESTRIYRDLGERLEVAINLCRFARALTLEGRAAAAAQLLASSEALHAEIGARMSSWVVQMNEGTLTTIRMLLDEAAFAAAWEQGRALTTDEAVALALHTL
ncbi:MAG TPA: tetratricopeptide repeat protein, partial [bacterium]|nr:tetratricopeptide repeat protein [bacterium]